MEACKGFKKVARGWRMPRFGGRGMRRVYGKAPCQNRGGIYGFCHAHRDANGGKP